jgi:NADPH-ferrihemoprotein reductase
MRLSSASTLSQQLQEQRPEQPLAKKKNGGKGGSKEKDGNDDPFFRGLCSNYLAGCGPASKNQQQHKPVIRVFVRPSSFRLPTDPSVPIILIGPGTGIAPMRAFLQERSLQPPHRRGPTVLYFGCRSRHVDFLYRDELVEYQTIGVLDDLRTAFSRDGSAKVYVQHLLQYHCEETVQWIIHRRAHVYVCGAVQMGHDVNATLQRILAGHVPPATKSAKDYLDQMSAEGRYVQELWA